LRSKGIQSSLLVSQRKDDSYEVLWTVNSFFRFFWCRSLNGTAYFFTCFTIDTSLLWALLAHHEKVSSGVLGVAAA